MAPTEAGRPVPAPREEAPRQEHPVAAQTQPTRPARQPRAIPFDDNEDLDVPDFLK
jgi:hypothetical protein